MGMINKSWQDEAAGKSNIEDDRFKFQPDRFWKRITVELELYGEEFLVLDPYLFTEVWVDDKKVKEHKLVSELGGNVIKKDAYSIELDKVCSINVKGYLCGTGKNANGKVTVKAEYGIELKQWMSTIKDDTLLGDISIPGTHDSGTANLDNCPDAGYLHCQNFYIDMQLNEGIRFLDIRLECEKERLFLMHGCVGCLDKNNKKLDLETVLKWCQQFLKDNPSETVLMSVKKEWGDTDIAGTFRKYVNELNNGAYKDLFHRNCNVPSLGEARGKIVLFKRFEFDDFGINWSNGWGDNANFEISTGETRFVIDDRYKEHDTNKKVRYVEENIKNATVGEQRRTFYVTFVSIAGYGLHTPYNYAWGCPTVNPAMNPKIAEIVGSYKTKTRLGTVFMDFYNDKGNKPYPTAAIINSNF